MGVFANLIPGVREVRAPLAAGGILLLALALAVEPYVPEKDSADGLVASFIAINEAMGSVGRGVVVAFVAYLLGSVVQVASSKFASRLPLERLRMGVGPDDLSLEFFTAEKVSDAFDRIETAFGQEIRAVAKEGYLEDLISFRSFSEVAKEGKEELRSDVQLVSEPLARRIASERAVIQRRLLGEEPEWFGEVDRFQAEAELREAIALPLLVLGVVCALRMPAGVAAPGVFFGTFLFVVLLIGQANQRRQQADETLVDAVTVKGVKPPPLERFEADLATALSRASARDPSADIPS